MKHIVYTKKGMWKFYYDSHLGICFYEPDGITPMILFENGLEDFSVSCDTDSSIYLLCQDDKNSIWLFFFDNKKWTRQCIFESKSLIPYKKQFQTVLINGWLNAFYTIKHGNKYMLIHHILNNEDTPNVIEQADEPLIFTVFSDNNFNLHCVYKKENLGEKIYNWTNKSWCNFLPLAEVFGDIVYLCAIADADNKTHFTYCSQVKMDYSVCYGNKSGVQELMCGISVNPKPIIFYYEKFYVLFRLGGRLLKTYSDKPDEGFLKPTYYFPGSFSAHDLFKISCPENLCNYGIYVNEIYGTEIRPDRFDASIIGEKLNEMDFSVPLVPMQQPFEIEKFVDNSAPFEKKDESPE